MLYWIIITDITQAKNLEKSSFFLNLIFTHILNHGLHGLHGLHRLHRLHRFYWVIPCTVKFCDSKKRGDSRATPNRRRLCRPKLSFCTHKTWRCRVYLHEIRVICVNPCNPWFKIWVKMRFRRIGNFVALHIPAYCKKNGKNKFSICVMSVIK